MDKTKIIVVEDNIVYCEYVCNMLSREGYHTMKAYHLSTAKKHLQQATDNDIVVADLRLPDGNGIDLLRWMRKEGKMQPFIIMTDYAEVHTAVEMAGACRKVSLRNGGAMGDYMVRATAANAQVRAFAVTTKELVETARQAHNTSPVVTAALGRLLTAGVMMGSMLKGDDDLLTLQVRGDGPVRGLTVTANAKGEVKGYATVPDVILPANAKGKLDVGGAVGRGTLSVIRDLGLKEPYVGQTALVTGEIGDDLTSYFATSEQTPSSVGLGVLMAGGFIIQLMPFAEEETISKLEHNLSLINSVTALLDQGMTPEQLLERVLDGFDVEITDRMPCSFTCNCSKERVEKALF